MECHLDVMALEQDGEESSEDSGPKNGGVQLAKDDAQVTIGRSDWSMRVKPKPPVESIHPSSRVQT